MNRVDVGGMYEMTRTELISAIAGNGSRDWTGIEKIGEIGSKPICYLCGHPVRDNGFRFTRMNGMTRETFYVGSNCVRTILDSNKIEECV